jgi:hypothetical protein
MARAPILLAAALALSACSSRPPWADGQPVIEERPAGSVDEQFARFEARVLAVHNRERAAVGAPPLRWDPDLARGAASYGPALAALGKLRHATPDQRAGQGENLWMGTAGAYQLEEMIGHWAAEKSLFRPGRFPHVMTRGKWQDVAHYTQMIWRGTARVGCAVHTTAKWDFLICRYSPPGNVVGQSVP